MLQNQLVRLFNNRTVILSLVLIIFLTIIPVFVGPARAVSYVPGVFPGNTMTYGTVSASWHSAFSGPPPFPNIAEFLNVRTTHLQVDRVNFTQVGTTQSYSFTNGTSDRSVVKTGDIATGTGNLNYWILAGGLKAGDPIYSTSSTPGAPIPTLNKTYAMQIAGVSRLVNNLTVTSSGAGNSLNFGFVWDVQTGILISLSSDVHGPAIGDGTSFVKLTSTSIWTGSSAADFAIISDQFLSVLQGSTSSLRIRLLSLNRFTGNVVLSANAYASGLVLSLNPSTVFISTNTTADTFLRVTASTAPGIYNLTITGSSGTISHTQTIALQVRSSNADFNLGAFPSFLSIQAGTTGSATIIAYGINQFTGTINLDAVPIGNASVSIFPSSITLSNLFTNGTAILTVNDHNTSPADYVITVTGNSGTVSKSVMVSVHVTGSVQSDFSLNAFPQFLTIIAGGTGSSQVAAFPLGPVTSSFTVALAARASPTATGLTLSLNPTSITVAPNSTPEFSTLTAKTSASTRPGNYTITITGTNGFFTHTTTVALQIIPPPVLKLTPSMGPVGTKVLVQGSGFPRNQFGGPNEILVTFDDQSIGFTFITTGSFDFTFNIPDAQAGMHLVKALEPLFFGNTTTITATAPFQVTPDKSQASLSINLQVGTLYFSGETATIFVQTSQNGVPTTINDLQLSVQITKPNGSTMTVSAKKVGTGLYKATWTIWSRDSLGTYAVVAKAHSSSLGDASALASFQIKLSWIQSNGTTVGIGLASAGVLGLAGLGWRKGYFTRKKSDDNPDVSELYGN